MIRILTPDDAAEFWTLRLEALHDAPLSFGAEPGKDFANSVEEVRGHLNRAPDSVTFGAFVDGVLVGTAGCLRGNRAKTAHKVHLWGMYVAPEHRRAGLAHQLVDAVIAHARALDGVAWIELGVSSTAPGAQRLYEGAGFRVWGTEPDALRHDGGSGDQHFMSLRL